MKELDVYVGSRIAGKLFKLSDHEYIFRYSTTNEDDFVSLTMPVRVKDYETQVLHPIFQMNLPEGFNLEVIRNKFAKLVDLDDLGLLQMVGGRQIGRVGAVAPGEKPMSKLKRIDDKSLLGSKASLELLNELIEQYAPDQGVSGMQPKVLLASKDNHERERKAFLSTPTHIFKSSREYQGLSVNEYFCLRAAHAAGIAIPDVDLSKDGEVLRVKRFDVDDSGASLGFEEAVVLRGLSRHGKYSASIEELYESLITFVDRHKKVEQTERFFAMVVANVALRNGDAHMKNFGVLYRTKFDGVLAPAYDIVTTTVYIPKDIMGLSLDGEKEWPTREKLVRFARHMVLTPEKANRIIDRVTKGIEHTIDELRAYAKTREDRAKLIGLMDQHWRHGIRSLGVQAARSR